MKKQYPLSNLMKNSFYHRTNASQDFRDKLNSDFEVVEWEIIKFRKSKIFSWLVFLIFLFGIWSLWYFLYQHPEARDVTYWQEKISEYANNVDNIEKEKEKEKEESSLIREEQLLLDIKSIVLEEK